MRLAELASEALGYRVAGAPLGPFGTMLYAPRADAQLMLKPEELRALLTLTPLLLFRGFRALSREELLATAARDPESELLHWDFGPVMELQVRENAQNYLFSTENVPFHWDGAFHRVPSHLVFSCVRAPAGGAGGETLFTSTEAIVNDAKPELLARWQATRLAYETEKKAHYGGRFETPMVNRHPRHGRTILRYAEPVETKLNPVSLEVTAGPFRECPAPLIEDLRRRIYDPRYCHAHRWQDGDFLIADNHSLIHGRNAFQAASPRHIRRVQLL